MQTGHLPVGQSEPVDSTAPACSSSIAPSARLSAGSRAAACLLQPLAPARAFRKDPCPMGNLEQTRQPKNDALARRNQLDLNLPDLALQGGFQTTFDLPLYRPGATCSIPPPGRSWFSYPSGRWFISKLSIHALNTMTKAQNQRPGSCLTTRTSCEATSKLLFLMINSTCSRSSSIGYSSSAKTSSTSVNDIPRIFNVASVRLILERITQIPSLIGPASRLYPLRVAATGAGLDFVPMLCAAYQHQFELTRPNRRLPSP